MRALLSAVLLVGVLAGCGVAHEVSKQAETVHSVAAEGALLAHEARKGSLESFTRVHADALRELLGELRPAIEDRELGSIADDVDRSLEGLADDPGDRRLAGKLERALEQAATAAEEVGG